MTNEDQKYLEQRIKSGWTNGERCMDVFIETTESLSELVSSVSSGKGQTVVKRAVLTGQTDIYRARHTSSTPLRIHDLHAKRNYPLIPISEPGFRPEQTDAGAAGR